MSRLSKNDVWAIIPAYNESRHIAAVLEETLRHLDNVVVVDDGSKDNTGQVSIRYPVKLLSHITNLGKGAALKTGCMYALQNGAKVMVVLDSDGQHEAGEIGKFLAEIEKGNDIVFGARRFDKNMPFMMKLGNKTINTAMKWLYNVELKDTQSGYRCFTRAAYEKIAWKSNDYSVESEMIANTGKSKLKYSEIEIKTIYSDKYKGTTVLDGIKIVGDLIKWRLTG